MATLQGTNCEKSNEIHTIGAPGCLHGLRRLRVADHSSRRSSRFHYRRNQYAEYAEYAEFANGADRYHFGNTASGYTTGSHDSTGYYAASHDSACNHATGYDATSYHAAGHDSATSDDSSVQLNRTWPDWLWDHLG